MRCEKKVKLKGKSVRSRNQGVSVVGWVDVWEWGKVVWCMVGCPDSAPCTLTTSLTVLVPSSSSSNGPTTTPLTTRVLCLATLSCG